MAGGGGGNSTTRVEPPKYQLPYLQSGLSAAQNLYNQQSGGQNMVAPFSGDTENAFGMIRSQAIGPGSGITGNANNLANQTLSGGFLGSNPYLDQTFNKAALATQNQLASEFARSGRNVGASEGLRSQQLNDLATGIYGGAYDQERNRQNQVLGMSGQLDAANYNGANALLGIGAQQENLNQQQLDARGSALDQYLQRVGGSYGQTNIASGSGNRMAGALGGGMLGSQLGSQFGGNGGLYGGILGSLGGYFGG
jgi:hypothetical protein